MLLFAFLIAGRAPAGPDGAKPEKPAWGKEVGGLAVSLSPAGGGPGKYVVRWRNVGQEALEVPRVRFGSDRVYKGRDDLWHHVFLRGPDGALAPARKYNFPSIGGPPYRPRTVVLGPEKTHEETIDLWAYVDRPGKEGRYRLWIEPDIRERYAPSREGARYWTGKIRSNALEVQLPK
jgi:hypothetical protein